MKVIKPVEVTSSNLKSSTAPETQAAWSSSTSYSTGAVVYQELSGIYQSLADSNLNNPPDVSPLKWSYIGPTNKWAMLDSQISTATTANQTFTATVFTGAMNGLALLNVMASTINVVVRDGLTGPIIYQKTQSLIGEVTDWYQYFFYDIDTQRTQAIFLDIPTTYINTHTTITLTGEGVVSLGTMTFGRVVSIGKSEYGVSTGITDYSVKTTDEFGITTFVKRAYSKRMSANILIGNGELNRTQKALYELRAVPALWIASDNPTFEQSLIVYGYYKDFSTDISYPTYSYCSLEIEGLI